MINVYIVDYFNIGRANGLSTYVSTLTKGIASNDKLNLHYIWINSSGFKNFEKAVKEDGVHYYIPRHIADPNDAAGYDVKVVDFLAKDMTGQQNVVVHFNWINHCPFAYLLKRKVKCKVLLTKHCIPWRDLILNHYSLFLSLNNIFNRKKNTLGTPPALVRERISYEAVDHIICVTEYARSVLTDLFNYSHNKTTVIYNGLDENILLQNTRDKGLLRKKYHFDQSEKIILFAGNVDERKGTWDLLRAFEDLEESYPGRNLRLLIAGPGKHSQALSVMNRLWSKVTFSGNIDKKTLYDFYAVADMGVVPSYVEQCSYTAIEMMFAGLPLIVADVDGLKEMVPEDCGLKLKLVLGDRNACIDADDLKDKIRYFIEHEEESKQYAVRAKHHARRYFRADEMVDKTMEVYRRLLVKDRLRSIRRSGDPLISILLPCYNEERYISECLKSIFDQTYSNFEILIINDGSTDDTGKIINKIKDPRIHYCENATNRGIEYSRNKIVSFARGEYAACIDADDMMHPDRLMRQISYLEQNPSVAMIGSWHYVIDQFGRTKNILEHPVKYEEIRLLMLFRNPFSHPSVMIRTNILKEMKYSDHYKFCEDYELWFRVAAEYQVGNIPDHLIFYRIHENNVSGLYSKEQKRNVMELHSDQLRKLGIHPSVQEMAIHAAICFGYGKRYFNSLEKINSLISWVKKVSHRFAEKYHYKESYMKRMEFRILFDFCGIEPRFVFLPDSMNDPKRIKNANPLPM